MKTINYSIVFISRRLTLFNPLMCKLFSFIGIFSLPIIKISVSVWPGVKESTITCPRTKLKVAFVTETSS